MNSTNSEQIRERLVAHRGDHEDTPENTLASFERAVAAGACWLECDIQFTRDTEPVVLHDDHLGRLCGIDRNIASYNFSELSDLSVSEPARIGKQLEGQPILVLSDLLQWLDEQPHVSLFLEIKEEALGRLSPEKIAKIVLPMIAGRKTPIIPISSSAPILEALHTQCSLLLGWVVEGPQPKMPLDYVFLEGCDEDAIQSWHGCGAKVAVYTINKADKATGCWAAGANLVETDYFTALAGELSSD